MKVTEPLDIHIADKIFQLQSAEDARRPADPAAARLCCVADQSVVFGGQLRHRRAASHEQARGRRRHACTAFSRSRDAHRCDARARRSARRSEAVLRAHGGDRLRGHHGGGALDLRSCVRTPKQLLRATIDDEPPRSGDDRPGGARPPRRDGTVSCSSSHRARTRGAVPGTACTRPTKAGVVNLAAGPR